MTNYSVPTHVSRVVGIDSSTKTGIAVFENDIDNLVPLYIGKIASPKLKGWDRCAHIETQFVEIIEHYKPEFALIEGYAYGNKFSLVPLVEIGTIMRRALIARNVCVGTLSPNSLKKYVTGDGSAPKSKMVATVADRWGHKTKDNDQADAYGLGRAAIGYLAINCISPAERRILTLLSLLHSSNITP